MMGTKIQAPSLFNTNQHMVFRRPPRTHHTGLDRPKPSAQSPEPRAQCPESRDFVRRSNAPRRVACVQLRVAPSIITFRTRQCAFKKPSPSRGSAGIFTVVVTLEGRFRQRSSAVDTASPSLDYRLRRPPEHVTRCARCGLCRWPTPRRKSSESPALRGRSARRAYRPRSRPRNLQLGG